MGRSKTEIKKSKTNDVAETGLAGIMQDIGFFLPSNRESPMN